MVQKPEVIIRESDSVAYRLLATPVQRDINLLSQGPPFAPDRAVDGKRRMPRSLVRELFNSGNETQCVKNPWIQCVRLIADFLEHGPDVAARCGEFLYNFLHAPFLPDEIFGPLQSQLQRRHGLAEIVVKLT